MTIRVYGIQYILKILNRVKSNNFTRKVVLQRQGVLEKSNIYDTFVKMNSHFYFKN